MKASLAPLAAIAVALAAAAPAGRDASAPRSQSRDAAAPREAGPDGMLVLAVLSPERALVADPRTGATSARVLPGGTLCHGPLFAVGGRMLLSGSRGGRAVALAAPLERRGHARALGPAQLIVPSATPGRVWLGSWTQADHVAGRLTLREVDTAGRVRAQTSRWLPRWSGLEAEIDGGFLMTDYHGVVLRGPKRVRIRDAWPIAAAGSRFAWCDDPCRRVGIWDAGTRRSFDPPRGLRPQLAARAAFSPDGKRLALAAEVDGRSRAAVIDLERGGWSVVPRVRLGDYAALAWSPSGRWLYIAGVRNRLLASRGGTGRPVKLPIRPGGTVMSIASTPGSAGP